jgi:DNA polymerase-3 subunit alpha
VCNKRVLENLALAGGFDSFENTHRAQFFAKTNTGRTFLEDLVKYGANVQGANDSNQVSLFGETEAVDMPEPIPPVVDLWNSLYALNKEKEVVGIYISGHPLDDFKHEIKTFCTSQLSDLEDIANVTKTELKVAGIVTHQEVRFSQKGNQFGTITLEDFTGSFKLFLFGEDFMKFKMYMVDNACLFIHGKIATRTYNSKDKELKIQQIELLSELRESKVNEIRIKLENSFLSASFIQDIHELFIENEGKCRLRFIVEDPVSKIQLNMPSKNIKVDVNDRLLRALEEKNIEFDLVG